MPTIERETTDTGRWGRIPAWWLDHPDLDADGFAILAALATYADEHGTCWPSQSTLAAKLKRSRPTINRLLQRLSDLGLVMIERRSGRDGARLSCRYRLRLTADATMDRDDSRLNAPCPPPSQEQLHSKQIPDSLTERGRGSAPDRVQRNERQADAQPDALPAETVPPPDWMPSADDLAWARAHFGNVDLGRHVEGFLLRCRAHGYRYRDVGSAWRAWLLQDASAGKAPRTPGAAGPAGASHATTIRERAGEAEQARMTLWAGVAQRLRTETPCSAAPPVFDPSCWQQL